MCVGWHLCRVYENGEVDVCIPPNIPEQIMSKVEACQERMKHKRVDPRAVMPQELTNESKAGGGEDDEWDGVQESKADVPSRRRRHKTKKKKQMLFWLSDTTFDICNLCKNLSRCSMIK